MASILTRYRFQTIAKNGATKTFLSGEAAGSNLEPLYFKQQNAQRNANSVPRTPGRSCDTAAFSSTAPLIWGRHDPHHRPAVRTRAKWAKGWNTHFAKGRVRILGVDHCDRRDRPHLFNHNHGTLEPFACSWRISKVGPAYEWQR